MQELKDMTVEELLKLQCSLCSGWGKEDVKLQREYKDVSISEIKQELLSCFAEQEKKIAQLEECIELMAWRIGGDRLKIIEHYMEEAK